MMPCAANKVGRQVTGQHDSQWAAIVSIAAKIGCTAETLRGWVGQHERDSGQREGPTTAEHKRVKELEREVRELRKAKSIRVVDVIRRTPGLPRSFDFRSQLAMELGQ